jgi:hypothetical protein
MRRIRSVSEECHDSVDQSMSGDGEHRRAGVHAGDRTVLPDDVEDVNDVEPRPAADVKHLVAGLGSQCFLGERAPPSDVARAVDDLELRRGAFVEIDLIPHCRKRCTKDPAVLRTRTREAAAETS